MSATANSSIGEVREFSSTEYATYDVEFLLGERSNKIIEMFVRNLIEAINKPKIAKQELPGI